MPAIAKTAPIFVAGHRGLVGSAIVRRLQEKGYVNVITATRGELDLLDQYAVHHFMKAQRPEYVFVAAAKVGGIHANNSYPAEFIFENLMIECNLIDAAYRVGINRLLFLGSSCIYPRDCPQPMKEEYLLTGPLEPTNEPYAVAKIAGIKMCEAYNRQYGTQYISVMPTNLYGPNDNFNLANSHVLPALIRKAHEARSHGQPVLKVWGTGNPRREFLHVDDMAAACVFLMEVGVHSGLYNVGTGTDVTIRDLAQEVCAVVGFSGRLEFDVTAPDGTPQKLLSVGRLSALGWRARIGLTAGIRDTYEWYLAHQHELRS
jgi:GDP-L-fucose synthase